MDEITEFELRTELEIERRLRKGAEKAVDMLQEKIKRMMDHQDMLREKYLSLITNGRHEQE